MSARSKTFRDVANQAKALGYAVSRTGLGHLRCTHRTGALVFVSAGDPRAERAAVATLRKFARPPSPSSSSPPPGA